MAGKSEKKSTETGVAKRRKRRSPEEIKNRLLTAAEEEFRRVGYGATTAAIAKRADVTEGQLYRYFDSKNELLREAIFLPLNQKLSDFNSSYLAEIADMDDKKQRASTFVIELQQFVNENPELLMALALFKPYQKEGKAYVSELDALYSYFDVGSVLLESRQFNNTSIPSKMMAKITFATSLATVLFKDWIFPEFNDRDDDLVELVSDFLIATVHSEVVKD